MVTETQTGFLGSGWTSEFEPSAAWPEDEERSGGRIKKTLLIVAAVAVVLGGTVIGVRALSGSESTGADCPPAGCATAASNQPEPEPDLVGEPEPEPDEVPDEGLDDEPTATDETAEAADSTAAATPTPTPTARGGSRVTPTPRPTATRKATRAPQAPDDPSPADEPEPTPTFEESLVVGEHRSPAPEQSPSTTAPTAVPSETFAPPVPAGGAAITVGAALMRSRTPAYTVKLVVAADRNVENLKVSVPVSGKVSAVSGAGWEQVGDRLVIDSRRGVGGRRGTRRRLHRER